jgi:hypothetical protein
MTIPRSYIPFDAPIAEARRRKWLIGRAKYGRRFQGDPVCEFYEECLDGANYCDEMERRGYRSIWVGRLLMWLASIWIRWVHRTQNHGA